LTVWLFVAFAIIFGALVYAHFALAYRAWRISRQEQPSDIDPSYVKLEDYFARSFRSKVSQWLNLPVQAAKPDGSLLINKGRERIRVTQSIGFRPQSRSDDILVVRGTFHCRAGCVFSREIYVRGDAWIGAGTRLQSIAADGNVTLGSSVHVARWADSRGDLHVGANSIVRARATAGGILVLGDGAEVGAAFASTVSSVRHGHKEAAETADEPRPRLQIPLVEADGGTGHARPAHGVDPGRIKMLGDDSCLYDGDFKPFAGLRVTTKLIVKGDCTIPAGSVLESDLKAKGFVHIGPGSVCRGNVISEGEIRFDGGSRFYGVVHAGKTLRLGSGVCGGRMDASVAAFSADTLFIESGVVVHGKVASGTRVVATSAIGKRSSSL